jgi:fucose 4-O-acetylase-like acetyltransferase
MKQQKLELKEITLLQSFGIFLVVFGHSYVEVYQHPNNPILYSIYWLHDFIYSFHMPLFMFISGLLFSYNYIENKKLEYTKFISNRFTRIIIPYIVISSFAFPIKAILSKYAERPVEFSFSTYLHTLLYPTSNTIFFYWFLPTLFAISLLAPFIPAIDTAKTRNYFIPIITLILLFLNIYNPFITGIFNVKGIAHYFIFFWSGYVFFIFKDRILNGLESFKVIILLFILLLALNLVGCPAALIAYNKIAAALLGILVSVGLSYKLLEQGIKAFNYINGYSYQIYLLSWFPQIFIKIIFYNILHFNFYFSFILMLFGGIFIPVFLTKLTKRNLPRMGFIIGIR